MMLLTPQATLWARKLCRALTFTQTASGEPCGALGLDALRPGSTTSVSGLCHCPATDVFPSCCICSSLLVWPWVLDTTLPLSAMRTLVSPSAQDVKYTGSIPHSHAAIATGSGSALGTSGVSGCSLPPSPPSRWHTSTLRSRVPAWTMAPRLPPAHCSAARPVLCAVSTDAQYPELLVSAHQTDRQGLCRCSFLQTRHVVLNHVQDAPLHLHTTA